MLRRWFTARPRITSPRKPSPFQFTQLESREVPSGSPVDPPVLIPSGLSESPAVVSPANSTSVAQQQEGRITEALIDFTKLPAAGTAYTLKITVTGNDARASMTITVDNSEGANSPKDTRDAVVRALNQNDWSASFVGDTKLRVNSWTKYNLQGHITAETDIQKVDITGSGLKDNQLPSKSLTRVSRPAGSGISTSVGGTQGVRTMNR